MKCAHCGLPLSPTNIYDSCPRCHNSLLPAQTPIVHQSQEQFPFPPASQTPFPSAENPWQSAPTPIPGTMQATISHNSAPYMIPNRTPGVMYSTPTPTFRPQAPRPSNLGFIVAALCVITGGLILVSVFFIAISLPSASTTNSHPATPLATQKTLAATPITPTTPPLSPTAIPSPTVGAFPGQQYIDGSQMASSVNINTAQPLQLTTTFRVNQKIYVTFNIHPDGKSGAVCLYWYLNNKIVTQFPFAVTTSAKAGYSYAIYGGTGPAYVEIFWASTTSCSDKILAQHVTFTLTH